MKIRTGFVSNSSSSSFVLLGSFVDDLTEEQKELIENHDFLEFEQDDESGDCIGVDPDYFEQDLTIREIKQKTLDEIKLVFPEMNIENIHFCSGTYYS